MATIVEIARRAGVSIGTVSNVIHGRRVSPRRQQVVQDAMAALGYDPDHRRSQRRRPAAPVKGIALVILGNPIQTVARHPIYATLIHGVERGCDAMNLPMRMLALPDMSRPDRLRFESDEAAIVFGQFPGDGAIPLPLTQVTAVKVIGERVEAWDHVTYDGPAVGRLAAEHLLGRGCREALYVGLGDCARQAGFLAAMRDAGAAITSIAPPTINSDAPRLDQELDHPRLRTAIVDALRARREIAGLFLYSDNMAATAYAAAGEVGRVPQQDLPIISCNNDEPYLASLWPPAVTIDIQLAALGRLAVRTALDRAQFPEDPVRQVILPPRRVAR